MHAALISIWQIFNPLKRASPEMLLTDWWTFLESLHPCTSHGRTSGRLSQVSDSKYFLTGCRRPTVGRGGQKRPTPYCPGWLLQHFTRKDGAQTIAWCSRNKTWGTGQAHYTLPLLCWKDQVSRYPTKTKSPAHRPAVPRGLLAKCKPPVSLHGQPRPQLECTPAIRSLVGK